MTDAPTQAAILNLGSVLGRDVAEVERVGRDRVRERAVPEVEVVGRGLGGVELRARARAGRQALSLGSAVRAGAARPLVTSRFMGESRHVRLALLPLLGALLAPAAVRGESPAVERLLAIGACGQAVVEPDTCEVAARALDDPDPALRLAAALALAAGAGAHAVPVEAIQGALQAHAGDELVALALADALERARGTTRRADAAVGPGRIAPAGTTGIDWERRAATGLELLKDRRATVNHLAAGEPREVEEAAYALAWIGGDVVPALLDEALAAADAPRREAILRGASADWRFDLVPPRLLREAVRFAGVPPTMDDVEDAFTIHLACMGMPDPHPATASLARDLLALVPAGPIEALTRDADPALARSARLVLADVLAREESPRRSSLLLELSRDAHPAVRTAALLGLRRSLDGSRGSDAESPDDRDRLLVAGSMSALGSGDRVLRHAGALTLLERLELFPDLKPVASPALSTRAADPPATRAALAALRFARTPSETTLREALAARASQDDGRPGRLRFLLEERLENWQDAVASIMARSDGGLFVEAVRHSGGMEAEQLPVAACAGRLASSDETVRIEAAVCLSSAGPGARGSVDRMIEALERAPSRGEKEAHLQCLLSLAPADVTLHERLVAIARRLDLELYLNPLRGLSEEQLAAALRSTDVEMRKRAAEALVRDAPSFALAASRARELIATGRGAEGSEALAALVARPDRDFGAVEALELADAPPEVRGRRVELLALYRRDRARDSLLAQAAMRSPAPEERLAGLRAWAVLSPDTLLDPRLCRDGDARVRKELASLLGARWQRLDGDERARLDCQATLASSDAWRALAEAARGWPGRQDEQAAWRRASVVLPLVLSRARAENALADPAVRGGLARLAGPLLQDSPVIAGW